MNNGPVHSLSLLDFPVCNIIEVTEPLSGSKAMNFCAKFSGMKLAKFNVEYFMNMRHATVWSLQ